MLPKLLCMAGECYDSCMAEKNKKLCALRMLSTQANVWSQYMLSVVEASGMALEDCGPVHEKRAPHRGLG
jgi:hypothetical protein